MSGLKIAAHGHTLWNLNGVDIKAVGGCLYIISTKVAYVFTIDVSEIPEGQNATIEVTTENSNFKGVGNIEAGVSTGTMTKKITPSDKKMSFIVKKGATVKYSIVTDDNNYLVEGEVVDVNKNNTSDGIYDEHYNTYTISPKLHKRILTHTVVNNTNGTLKIKGYFTDNAGNEIITEYIIQQNKSQTFYVWSKNNKINYEITRTYYDTAKSGTSSQYGTLNPVTVTKDGPPSTPISTQLQKHKYIAKLYDGNTLKSKGNSIELDYGKSKTITAKWENWTTEEKNSASGTKWDIKATEFNVQYRLSAVSWPDVPEDEEKRLYSVPSTADNICNNTVSITLKSNYRGTLTGKTYKSKFILGEVYATIRD